MKKILFRMSSVHDKTQYITYFVTFPWEPKYAYTMKMTPGGWIAATKAWEQGGYKIEETERVIEHINL